MHFVKIAKFVISYISNYLSTAIITWITPPPDPLLQFKNSLGNPNSLPSQSHIITSSSVQAGDAIQLKPIHPIAELKISATVAG